FYPARHCGRWPVCYAPVVEADFPGTGNSLKRYPGFSVEVKNDLFFGFDRKSPTCFTRKQ
ncbi:MAG: hypothetical protein ACR2K1_01870, partial [Saprospiraceae bacterium]